MAKRTSMSRIIINKDELELLTNTEIFLIKAQLGKKMNDLFGECIEQINSHLVGLTAFPELNLGSHSPKISKGENYLSFPWQLLDYPRHFNKIEIFALRTLCWWGQGFSITLHLSGKYAETYHAVLTKQSNFLAENDYYICVNVQQWQHHFLEDNYRPAGLFTTMDKTISSLYEQNKFIKIMKKIPLSEWSTLPAQCGKICSDLISLLNNEIENVSKAAQ